MPDMVIPAGSRCFWRPGSRVGKTVDAQEFGEQYREIHDRKKATGDTTPIPDLLVEANRDEDAPAHDFIFNVDDGEAVVRYRRHRATLLVNSIEFDVPQEDGKTKRRRLAESVAYEVAEGVEVTDYVPHEVVLSDEDMRAQMADKSRSALENWLYRFEEFAPEASVKAVGRALKHY